MSKKVIFLIGIFFAVSAAVHTPLYAQTQKENKITGAAELGMTKAQVIKVLGKPNSPQKYDFFYVKDNDEIIVCFNDKTNRCEAVIVRGKSAKFLIGTVKLGNTRAIVKKAYGKAEKIIEYQKNKVECWYYPSKNIFFAFNKDKISSFSVSNYNVKR